MTPGDTLGRKIHPEFGVTGPLLSAAFSLGIKLQMWAMGADRRWASERQWQERIKECGRWQGRHAIYLTEQQGVFFTKMSSTAVKTQMRGREKSLPSALHGVTWKKWRTFILHNHLCYTVVDGWRRPVLNQRIWCFSLISVHIIPFSLNSNHACKWVLMKAWLDPHLHLYFHYEPQLSRKHLTPSITTETPLVLLWLQAKYKLSDMSYHHRSLWKHQHKKVFCFLYVS